MLFRDVVRGNEDGLGFTVSDSLSVAQAAFRDIVFELGKGKTMVTFGDMVLEDERGLGRSRGGKIVNPGRVFGFSFPTVGHILF